MKLPWIPEAPGCSLVVEHITVGRSFSQLFQVKPKHCVVEWGSLFKISPITEYLKIRILASDWMHKTTDASRNQKSCFLGAFGIQGKSNQDNTKLTRIFDME